MPNELKTGLARAQLGTALDLFMRDRDPVSVHVLSCGACELLEGVGNADDVRVLSTHILENYPDLRITDIKRMRNRNWNAMKHFYARDSKTVRDDEELLARFSDVENDTTLFEGWYDYQMITGTLPVEAQIFHMWYFALNEAKLAPGVDVEPFRSFFPALARSERGEQKRRLRRACEKYRDDKGVMADERTEKGSLSPRRGD